MTKRSFVKGVQKEIDDFDGGGLMVKASKTDENGNFYFYIHDEEEPVSSMINVKEIKSLDNDFDFFDIINNDDRFYDMVVYFCKRSYALFLNNLDIDEEELYD